MKDLIIMLWGILKVELSRQEWTRSFVGTSTGFTIGEVTKTTTELFNVDFGRTVLLMFIGAVISYFVPKVLKKWHNLFLDWRDKKKQERQ